MSTSKSNLSSMLKNSATTNNICLNYNGNHLIATLTDDVLQMVSTLPIVWEQNNSSGKAIKQSIYIDKWDEYTSSVEDDGYTVGEIVNGKMSYLNHVYLVHADNKALTTDAQKSVRQIIGTIAPYVGLKQYTVTSKTPAKNGKYLSWPWYGTTDSRIKKAYNTAIAEINAGCVSAEETLDSAKKWVSTRERVEDAGASAVKTENMQLKETVQELMAKLEELEASAKASKSTGETEK